MILRSKITILGDAGVGKTSLILKYVKNKFNTSYKPTLGADFTAKTINNSDLSELGEDSLELIIWDLAGAHSDELDVLTDYYIKGSNGFVLVYDVTNKESINNLEVWASKVKKICGDIPFIVVGNKMDLTEHISVTDDDIKKYKDMWDTEFLGSSAKTGQNVKDLFVTIAKLLI